MRRLAPLLCLWVTGMAACGVIVRHSLARALSSECFRLPADVSILVAGDSHTQTSVDPAVLEHSFNVSMSSENYFWTYYKLKLFLARNPQIRIVVLGFSYQNLSRGFEEAFIQDRDFPSEIYEMYYPIVDAEGREWLRRPSKNYVLSRVKCDLGVPLQVYNNDMILKGALGRSVKPADIPFYGGYYGSRNSRVSREQIRTKISKYFYEGSSDGQRVSTLMTAYLRKISELCEARGIELVLYEAPLHPDFRALVPAEYRDAWERTFEDLRRASTTVRLVDFSSMPLADDDFGDGDHVNHAGAGTASRELAKVLGG